MTEPAGGSPRARAAGRLATATLVSRLLGFIKSVLLVLAIGGTSAAVGGQAFEVANSAPTYLFALLAGGVLSAVLVPQIVRAMRQGDAGQQTLDRMVTLAIVGGFGLTIVLVAATPFIVWIYASTWSPEWLELATAMAYWCLPQVFFLLIYSVLTQVLNAREIFGMPAWAPAISNAVGIAGLIIFLWAVPSGLGGVDTWTPGMIALLCGSATLGVAVQAALVIYAARRAKVVFTPRFGFQGLRVVGGIAGWTFLGVAAGQLAYLLTSNVASAAGERLNTAGIDGASLNSLSTAYLLILVPHGVLAVSAATAMYPRMANSAADAEHADLESSVSRATQIVGLVILPSSAVLFVLGPQITQLVWGTEVIGTVLRALAVGAAAFSITFVLNRASFALNDGRSPFITQCVVAALSAAGALSASLLPDRLVVVGIAATISLANIIGWAAAAYLLRRRLRQHGHTPLGMRRATGPHARLIIAAVIAGATGWFASSLWETHSTTALIGEIVLVGGLVVAVYGLCAWILGDKTIRRYTALPRRRA